MDRTTSVKNDEYEQKISNGEWAGVIGLRVYNSNRPRLSMFHWRPSTSRKVEPILAIIFMEKKDIQRRVSFVYPCTTPRFRNGH